MIRGGTINDDIFGREGATSQVIDHKAFKNVARQGQDYMDRVEMKSIVGTMDNQVNET